MLFLATIGMVYMKSRPKIFSVPYASYGTALNKLPLLLRNPVRRCRPPSSILVDDLGLDSNRVLCVLIVSAWLLLALLRSRLLLLGGRSFLVVMLVLAAVG